MNRSIIIVSILCFILFCVGCTHRENEIGQITNSSSQQVHTKNISFFEQDTNNIDWNSLEVQFSLDRSLIPVELCPLTEREGGVEFGETLLLNIQNSGRNLDKELTSISHFLKDDIWVFDYATISEGWDLIDGGCFSVAVNGKTGEVIAAWAGE